MGISWRSFCIYITSINSSLTPQSRMEAESIYIAVSGTDLIVEETVAFRCCLTMLDCRWDQVWLKE